MIALDPLRIETQHRRIAGIADHQRAFAAKDLGAHVIAKSGAAAVVDNAQRVVGEPQRDHTGVDVIQLGEDRIDDGAAHGEELGNFLAHHPAHAVEVVDRHVAVETAGRFQVATWRGVGIAHGVANRLDATKRALLDEGLRFGVCLVKPALKAHLQAHARLVHGSQRTVRCLQVQGNRLLAEDLLASFSGSDDQRCVAIRRGADDDRVDGRIGDDALRVIAPAASAYPLGKRLGRRAVHIRDDRQLCPWNQRSQCGGVALSDAPSADERNLHPLRHGVPLLFVQPCCQGVAHCFGYGPSGFVPLTSTSSPSPTPSPSVSNAAGPVP